MEKILTKALDEVLTPRYSDELRGSYDTGYAFTVGFEEKMRELIRKTDRPPIKWRGYAAAAAAAVIAIGSAVLVPVILNSRVEVSPPELSEVTTTPAVISEEEIRSDTTDENEGELTVTSSVTPSESDDEPSPEGVYEPEDEPESGDHLITGTDIVDVAEPETAILTDSNDNTTADESETTSADEEETLENEMEEEGDIDVVTPTIKPTDSTDGDSDVITIEDGEEHPVVDIATSETEGSPQDEPEEEEAEIEDEEDIVVEPDEPEWIIDSQYLEGTKLSQIFSDNFGISFDDLWADSGNYHPEGSSKNGNFNLFYRDIPFLHEFVHKLGNAELTNAPDQDNNAEYINIVIGDVKNGTLKHSFYNASAWKNYNYYFGLGDDSDDEITDEEEPDEEDPDMFKNITFTVRIYRKTGIVSFIGNVNRYESGRYVRYKLNRLYKMTQEDVDTLFGNTEKMFFPKTVDTAEELASIMRITSDGITDAYADVVGVYDTEIGNAMIGSDYITGLFTKYSGRKLTKSAAYHVTIGVTATVYTDLYSYLKVGIDWDGKIYVYDGINQMYFTASADEFTNAVKAVGKASGVIIPVYSTLGQYLQYGGFLHNKNFNTITGVSIRSIDADGKNGNYILNAPDDNDGTLGKLADMIRSEFNSAKYIPEHLSVLGEGINVKVEGYRTSIRITKDDKLVIRTSTSNVFKLSDGFYERFRNTLLLSKHTVFVADDAEEDDVVYPEEVIDEEEYEDMNPIT